MVRSRKVQSDPSDDNWFPSSNGLRAIELLSPKPTGFSLLSLACGAGHEWGWLPQALQFYINTLAEGQALLGRKANFSA